MAHQIPAGCKGGGKGGWPPVPRHQANQPVVYYGPNGLEVKGAELGMILTSWNPRDPHIFLLEKRYFFMFFFHISPHF